MTGERSGFGELLRRYRVAAGLTQEGLAEKAGLSVRGLSDLERGLRQSPHPDTVRRLVQAFEIQPEDQAKFAAMALRNTAFMQPEQQPEREPVARSLSASGGVASQARHNLPLQLTSFVGRVQEIADIRRELGRTRLLTLTGPGGVGKTRLALRVAEEELGTHRDAIWFVELAPLKEATLVPHVVANVLQIRENPGEPLITTLTRVLQPLNLLLILDNCEHLLEACARLVDDLVRSCPHLQVLATSREALGLTGEIAWRAPSLSVPDAQQALTLAELRANHAVQLFVERASASEPRFTLTERNAPAAAQICRQLDGIPLALELAAARLPALTAEQLAARLDQRFRLLTGGSRAALPRQQTLRATLDWSYDLLTAPEQRMFNRLAVFAGGWRLEAAEVVCADDGIAQEDVLDLLARLVSKSLVIADDGADGAKRYRLLETVREYGRERLVAAGEADAVYQRHANCFLVFGEALEPERVLGGRTLWPSRGRLDQLECEQDNLRAATRWWIKSQDAERAIEQVAALFPIWYYRGSLTEGHAWLQEVLGLPVAVDNPAIRRRALPLFAHLARRHGEYAVAFDAFQELLAAQQSAGDPVGAAHTLCVLAHVHDLRADYTAGWACIEAAQAAARDLTDHELEFRWRYFGGHLALHEGRYGLARTLLTEARATHHAQRNVLASAYCLWNLAAVACEEGRYDDSQACLLEGLEIARHFNDRTLLAELLQGFSGLASALRQHERAVRLGGAAAALREATGAPLSPWWRGRVEHWLAVSRQAVGEEAAKAAWWAGQSLRTEQALDEAGGAHVVVTA